MEDLTVVDGRDESIGNGSDGLVKVGLGSKDIDGGLRRQRGISRDDYGGDRIEGDRQDGRLRWCGSGGLIGSVDRVVRHRRSGSVRGGRGNLEVKIAVRMEFQL